MTKTEYRAAIATLGLSQLAAGRWLGVSPKTAQRYAVDGPSGPAAVAVRLALRHGMEGERMMSIASKPITDQVQHTPHPLDGAFITTESIGGPEAEKRSATFKVAFTGKGCVERLHAAEGYLKALVAADRAR